MPFKSVFETALTDTWTAAQAAGIADKAGDLRWERDSEGMKCYKCVIYDTGAGPVAAVAGNVAGYYTLDGYKNHTVTCDQTDILSGGAGVLMSAPGDGEYCWIQIRGFATVTTALDTGTDGVGYTAVGASDSTLDVVGGDTEPLNAIAGDASDKEICCNFPF